MCSYNIYGKYSCSEKFNNNLDMCSQMVNSQCDPKYKFLSAECPKQCEAIDKYCTGLRLIPGQCDEKMLKECPISCRVTKKKAPQPKATSKTKLR